MVFFSSRIQAERRLARSKTTLAATNGIAKKENLPNVTKNLRNLAQTALKETLALTTKQVDKTAVRAPLTRAVSVPSDPLKSTTTNARNVKPAVAKPVVAKPVVRPAPRPATTTTTANRTIAAANRTIAAARKEVANAKPEPTKPVPKTATKKIPPYDYKARFNDLLEKHKALKDKNEELKEQLTVLDDIPGLYEQCKIDLQTTQEELTTTQSLLAERVEEVDGLKIKNKSLVETIQGLQSRLDVLENLCPELENKVQSLTTTVDVLNAENVNFKSENIHLKAELEACAGQLFATNMERKNLHNQVMDLKGNIRVFCRVRPPLSGEMERRLCQWNYTDECSLEIAHTDEKSKWHKHDFQFDQVFHPRSSQHDIFENVAPLIQSALDGYNVCIFAYGQTGSGKTYTMDGDSQNVGIIPRTVDLLFKAVQDYRRLGWDYEIRVQFLEIYNEVLYDLLSNEDKKLDICMVSATKKDEIFVSNLNEEVVNCEDDLRRLIQVAKRNRMTACTAGNERSSRSHAVTMIHLTGRHPEKSEVCVGKINLVDLAGSESPKTSTRMDETKSINKSLSELSNVILALVSKQEHIPYRNSKLTYLLMPSLGGNSKTLMFVNVSPFGDCHAETIKSLRFASTVNSCKMAKVKKNRILNSTS